MEQTFRALQKHWEGAEFHHTRFIITVQQQQSSQQSSQNAPKHHIRDGGTFTIIGKLYTLPSIQLISTISTFFFFSLLGLEMLLAQTKESVLTFSDMLRSPHVAEFQKDVEHWLLLLQEQGIILTLVSTISGQ